jgi:hypothetical protein
MSIIQGTGRGGARGFYDYPIEQSLRFDGSSYLSRTFGNGGNRNNWTFSAWVKRSNINVQQSIFAAYQDSSNRDVLRFNSGNNLEYQVGNSGNFYTHTSSSVFRDSSDWYHIVLAVNWTTQLLNVYVNNEVVATQIGGGFSQPATNIQTIHYLGGRNAGAGVDSIYNGYLANIQFIDGQALDASYFGETKDDIWVPKAYTGSYGANGFHLDFADSSNIGNDVSGNNNDWTVN